MKLLFLWTRLASAPSPSQPEPIPGHDPDSVTFHSGPIPNPAKNGLESESGLGCDRPGNKGNASRIQCKQIDLCKLLELKKNRYG